MGRRAEVLLVGRRGLLVGGLATLALAACGQREGRVEARAHDAFFLWAGVTAPDWLHGASTVYALAGEVRHDHRDFVPLRAIPRVRGPELWLTVRVERLDWDGGIRRAVLHLLDRWEAAGNRLAGLQIDFDAATHGLGGYARFLRAVRQWLPKRWGLSVTGLLDWSAGGDPAELATMAGTIDEIVMQTYQGRHTIPGYERYLETLRRLPMPYRVGLVEGGEWRVPEWLTADPRFRGYVVFLLNR